jgi:hypothetical protein
MKQRAIAIVAVLLLAACGSLGDLGLEDILGSTGAQDSSDLRGIVERVDTGNRTIALDVNYINNLRDDRQDSVIYYDDQTVVEYQGQQYRVDNLERGDEVAITGTNSGGRYVADKITVVRDASS